MRFVVRRLDGAAALSLVDGGAHGGRDRVGIHDDGALGVSRRAADRLDERCFAPEKALLIRVEDRNERYLGKVKALAQKVDADEHVKFAPAQIADDLHALHRADVVVHIARFDAGVAEIRR